MNNLQQAAYATKTRIFDYWKNELIRNPKVYDDSIGEKIYTLMSEDAEQHFKVATPNGDSFIEELISDWAIDYVKENCLIEK